MLKFILKGLLALALSIGWLFFSGDKDMSLMLGGLVFVVLLINPKRKKSYEEGEDYKAMVKEKQERKLYLAEERIQELQQAKDKKKK